MTRIVLLALLLLGLVLPAPAADRALLAPAGKTAAGPAAQASVQNLRRIAVEKGSVKVIVGLRVPFAPEARLKASAMAQQRAEIATTAASFRTRYAAALKRKPGAARSFTTIPFMALEVTRAELDRLAADPMVLSISENRPNRPMLTSSENLVGASTAWDGGYTGKNQTVVVIDSGIEKSHPYLAGKVIDEACFSGFDGCPKGLKEQLGPGAGVPCLGPDAVTCSHGTFIAGVIAGGTSSSMPPGMARDAKLISIQVFGPSSYGSEEWVAYDADIIKALEYVNTALRNAYKISAVNISIANGNYTSTCDVTQGAYASVIESLEAAGIATIGASGNDGIWNGIASPACISKTISVGAVSADSSRDCQVDGVTSATAADKVLCNSNTASFLSLLAPGAPIRSSIPGGGFEVLGGTSEAAAIVSGAWAVMKEKYPNASVRQILKAFQTTGKPVTDYRMGRITPRVDLAAAIVSLKPIQFTRDGAARSGSVSFVTRDDFASCDDSCMREFLVNTTVSLRATPAPGYGFAGWGGDCGGSQTSCTVTLTSAKLVSARFVKSVPLSYTNSAMPGAGGSVTFSPAADLQTCSSDCTNFYNTNSTVSVAAAPDQNSVFVGWEGAPCDSSAGTSPTCSVVMDSAKSISAVFKSKKPVLSYSKAGQGSGTVSFSPNTGSASCAGSCTNSYDRGRVVTLTAQPSDANSVFAGWREACSGTSTTCTVTMTGDLAVTAVFNPAQGAVLNYNSTGDANGRVTFSPAGSFEACDSICQNVYADAARVTITAVPQPGAYFTGWQGQCSGTQTTCTVSLSAATPAGVTATFKKLPDMQLSYVRTGTGAGTVQFNPAVHGAACAASCNKTYPNSTLVTLTAAAAAGSEFAGWQGACGAATTSVCTLTMSEARTAVAEFRQSQNFTLTYWKTGAGAGTVQFSPGANGSECSGSCSQVYAGGTVVTLTVPPPPAGSQFAGWQGACTGTALQCTVTMSEARSVAAEFTQVPTYQLSYVKTGSGSGTVQFSPASNGSECAGSCIKPYSSGTSVTLTVSPLAADSLFVGWQGACSGTALQCTVAMSEARAVAAEFRQSQNFTLAYAKAGAGAGTVQFSPGANGTDCSGSCTKAYASGTVVTLSVPTPPAGSQFAGWRGACAGTSTTCSVTMAGDLAVTAVFNPVQSAVLNYSSAGDVSGRVTFAPAGSLESCDASCQNVYADGTLVTLTAIPQAGAYFTGWQGQCSGTQTSCTLRLSAAAAAGVTASFKKLPDMQLSYVRTGTGAGAVQFSPAVDGAACTASCSKAFANSTLVTLTAEAAAGSQFAGWQGACSGTALQCTVAMSEARAVAAEFRQVPNYQLSYVKTGLGGGTVQFSPASSGTACNGSCTKSYASGTVVTLSVSSVDAGSEFVGWQGACSGTGLQCIVTMSDVRSVAAEFSRTPNYQLTFTRIGTGLGTMQISSPAGDETCATSCNKTFLAGTVVKLTAQQDSDFTAWQGSCSGTQGNVCTLTMSEAKTAVAEFRLVPSFRLSYVEAGAGDGSVELETPDGKSSCEDDCSKLYRSGTAVKITATPKPFSGFVRWRGDCTGTEPICSLRLTEAAAVTAEFAPKPSFALSIAPRGTGKGRVAFDPAGEVAACAGACTNRFPPNTRVTLRAEAELGSTFQSWSGACRGRAASCVVTMDAAKSVTPEFKAVPTYPLTYQKQGTGGGSVAFTPVSPGGSASCTENCTNRYNSGVTVTLTATPEPGSQFTGWSGACKKNRTCTVRMTAARSVTATFSLR